MTTDTSFAPDYTRNEEGLIMFPDDRSLRRQLFPNKVEHPAKNNLYMLQELVLHLSEPGDIILDPMAGAGSMMWMARHDRKMWLIELQPTYAELQRQNRAAFDGEITLFEGDCRKILPFPPIIQAVIFSPPYSNQIKLNAGMEVYDEEGARGDFAKGLAEFVSHPDNLSKLNDFQFDRAMTDIYRRIFESLKPGGFMCCVIKDQMKKGQRVMFGLQHVRIAIRVGFTTYEWHKRHAIGALFGRYNLKQGIAQVTDEHMLILQKPYG